MRTVTSAALALSMVLASASFSMPAYAKDHHKGGHEEHHGDRHHHKHGLKGFLSKIIGKKHHHDHDRHDHHRDHKHHH